MARLSVGDREWIDRTAQALRTRREGARPALERLLPEVTRRLDADRGLAFGYHLERDALALDFAHLAGFARPTAARRALARLLRDPHAWPELFDPVVPAERDRDCPRSLGELAPRGVLADPPLLAFLRRGPGAPPALLRVLVCDGPCVLAWVGFVRPAPFGVRERGILAALVPHLKRRLVLDRAVRESTLEQEALATALGAIDRAALVTDDAGAVELCNEAARTQLACDGDRFLAALRACLRGEGGDGYRFDAVRVAPPSRHARYLVIAHGTPQPTAAVDERAREWSLTARQAAILRLVAAGKANKEIAVELDCAENTVEYHVTAILRRAGVRRRTELQARLWGGAGPAATRPAG